MSVPLVRCSAYIPFLDFLEEVDIRPKHGFDKSFIAAIVEKDIETLLPVHLAHTLLEKGSRTLGLDNFGYIAGQNARIGDLGAFGYSLRNSMTLHDALGKLRTKFPLYSSAEQITWTLSSRNQDVQFFHHYHQRTGSGSRYAQQCALLLMRDIVRLTAGAKWQPVTVFSPVPSKDKQIMTNAFAGAAISQSFHYGFSFPSAFLHRPIDPHSSTGNESGYAVFEASVPARDFIGMVKQVIAALIIDGRYQLGEVTEAIGMKPRTLQRHLNEYGTHFSEVLSQVRFELAMKLMSDRKFRIIDVAFELGYSDPAHFTRAFRSWTGTTPAEFQRKQYGVSV